MRIKLLLTLLLLSFSFVAAQIISVKGIVLDNAGVPVIGANVSLKNASGVGAITDIDGNFSLNVPANSTLVISYIGYTTTEVKAAPQLQIVLKEDSELLDEVVVTGYGTFKKSAYSGAASTVKMGDKEDLPAVSFKQLLVGNAPGVQVTSNNGGALGAETSVTIRGLGSINASTSPLYVVDGVPVITSVSSGLDAGTDIMATLNTADIENITVIKDAAAASLYGSRAANGVIVITTKNGHEGKAQFNLRASTGFSGFTVDYRPVMTGPERREAFYEGLYNQAFYKEKKSEADAKAYADANIDKYAPLPWSGWADWESALFNDHASYQNYEFSASGGDKRSSYYTSLAYSDQGGIVRQQHLYRFTARVNARYKMTDNIQLGVNVLYSSMRQHGSSEGTTYTSPMYATRHKVSPSDPIYNQDGTYNQDLLQNGDRNPVMAMDMNYKKESVDRSFNTVYVNYTPIKGLKLNSTLSRDYNNVGYNSWEDPRSSDGDDYNGRSGVNKYQYIQTVWKNALSYETSIKETHNINALIGYETHEYKRNYIYGEAQDFPTLSLPALSNGGKTTGLSGYEGMGWRMLSYLATFNYNYLNKYYLDGSARLDGSSRLAASSRWGTFWSIAGSWRLSSEPFMNSLKGVIDDAKIRLSYGTNGNLPDGYYGYMGLYGFGYNYMTKPGIRETQIENDLLSWEKNYNLNLGIDFLLFDRVTATIDLYTRKTSDLLYDKPLSLTTGFSSYLTNIGSLQNRGIELSLSADILRHTPLKWYSTLNLGHNSNKILSLGGESEIVGSYTIRVVGEPYYQYYLKEFAGINPDTGVPQYYVNGDNPYDAEGKKKITEDASEAGYVKQDISPKLTGGWSNSLSYKGFNLDFNWTFTLGGYSYDSGASKLDHAGQTEVGAVSAKYLRRWKQKGDVTDIEMFMVGNDYTMASVYNTRRLHSTDHLRLKALTFSYMLPKSLLKPVGLTNARLYFSGDNLLTFVKFDDYDPEVPRDAYVMFQTPTMKTFTFGIDIKF